MNRDDIKKTILDSLSNNIGKIILEETDFFSSDVDSLDILETIYEVEEKYNFRVDDFEIAKTPFNTPKDLIDLCMIFIKNKND